MATKQELEARVTELEAQLAAFSQNSDGNEMLSSEGAELIADLQAQLSTMTTDRDNWKTIAGGLDATVTELRSKLSLAEGGTERFRGSLKDAAELHYQRRESPWDSLTVIFDTSS